MSIIKPMLAATIEEDRLHGNWPYLAQPKLDGIRAINYGRTAMSRSMKKIPNLFTQKLFKLLPNELKGLDGELIVGDPKAPDVYNRTQSEIMTIGGVPNVCFHVFDLWDSPEDAAGNRFKKLQQLQYIFPAWVKLVPSILIFDLKSLEQFEESALDAGFEGIILRNLEAPYKYGRSTAKQGYLLKRKEWDDTEAKIIGFEELMHNGNEASISPRGYTERSSHKENMIPGNMLGKFICVCDFNGGQVEVKIGGGLGLDISLRKEIWLNQDKFLGKTVKFKYTPNGSKDRPRHPTFLGFRDAVDM